MVSGAQGDGEILDPGVLEQLLGLGLVVAVDGGGLSVVGVLLVQE